MTFVTACSAVGSAVPGADHLGLSAREPSTPRCPAREDQPRRPAGAPAISIHRAAQHPEDVAVGKRERVAVGRAEPREHPVGPGADLVGRLAARAPVPPQVPVRVAARGSAASSAPRSRRSPTRAGPRQHGATIAEPGQLAGLAGAPERAAEHERERAPVSCSATAFARSRPPSSQRQIGAARVLARAGSTRSPRGGR